ncbi:focadhesin [Sitodiplosis mosellana]|uniref:focadhesin n=1 Tax=Sitodiplosis mosellana TaxID=263140 RepID=UPI0024452C4E|nr:focadhesin [Sitodiplosis mosellana]
MEDLKCLADSNNMLQLSKALQKIEKAIEQQKKDSAKKESAIEELNFLKEQCLSNNIQLSLLSSQSLYGLVENNVLEPANVLTMFITMLSNANTPMKMSIIGQGIINILLLDLKVATFQLKSNQSYVCPFDMKTAQHPVITLMYKKNVDILDLATKLQGIVNHENEHIRSNSIEFLRPVFLYVLCNPIQIASAESIWSVFLKQHRLNGTNTQSLLHEIFTWCRITPDRCLSLSTQLMETIEVYLEANNNQSAFEYQIYLIALILSLIEYGYDPRNAFNTILKTIQQNDAQIDEEILNYMLITMSQIVHNIAPFYLRNALEIIKTLNEQNGIGNMIIRNMVLDSLIIRLAINGKSMSALVAADIDRLIKQLRKQNTESKNICSSDRFIKNIQYLHPLIAMNFNLGQLSTELCLDDRTKKRLKHFISFVKANNEFANEMHIFLRSILLSIEDLALSDIWTDILKQLTASAKDNSSLAGGTIYFILYLLAKETEGRKQMELLRGLTSFTAVKENMSLILNTYRSLSSSSSTELQIISIDLHTRLWLAENRTYQFLHKVLITDDEKLSVSDRWEMNVVKANAIKEICSQKASQHGTDLVAPLSKILNCSLDNDLASSLSLDAVIWLCKSHTVNIVSTWKVLRRVFESEPKPRTTKSLCEFFGEVSSLKSASNEYDLLFCEALKRLWNFITNSEDIEIIRAALRALRNFDLTELTLKHIPHILFNNIKLPREYQIQIAASHNDPNNDPLTISDVLPYIPGECLSIELFKNINQRALDDSVEFVTHLVEMEMSQFRSGVYFQAEGRPEPKELQNLHARSQLRAMIRFLCEQSERKSEPATAIQCLKCVAKKYSRPIPPLNWFFLIEYINNGMRFDGSTVDDQFKMKKYALMIAGNQSAHSGSAKSIVENYLQSFDSNTKNLEEIQITLEISVKSLGISPRILAAFLRNTLTFAYDLSASSHFEEKCHLEMGLESIVKTFDEKSLVPENVDIIIDAISRFNDILPRDSKIYDKYSTYVLKLPCESLDRLSTPVEWNSENFRKSLTVRAKAASFQKKFPTGSNPCMWINLLIDNAFDLRDPVADAERKEELLMTISDLLMEWQNERFTSEWIMYFLGKVQSNLNQDSTKETMVHSLFSLDLYMFCIVMVSGCATFVNDELSMNNRMRWLKKFPEALWLLSKLSSWDNHMPRIFEFLYHLKTQQNHLPNEYNSIICNTIICVRNHEYFLQKSTWNRFISLK